MEVTVDIAKYRVQPFKSYKVCVSLDDPSFGSAITPTCTHLFSFERAVPYVDARPSNALLSEVEMVKSANLKKDNAEEKGQAGKGSREIGKVWKELEGEADGEKRLEGRDLTRRVFNVTQGNKEEEKNKVGNITTKMWDDRGIEGNRKDMGREMGESVKNVERWEEGSAEVKKVLLDDTRDFVRDGFHGKVETALGEQAGEMDIEEMDIGEKKQKRSNGEILSSLAPLILVIISLL